MALNIDLIRARRPGQTITFLQTIDTTMRVAANMAAEGAASGTVVLADEQTAGVGRLGRTWHSERDAGVYMSVVLRLPLPPANLPLANLMLGLATADAIQNACGLRCDLRWPNDVLISERKAAGILAQMAGESVIAGIGINVNQSEFPADLRTPATSLRLQCAGKPQSREDIVVATLESLDSFSDTLVSDGPEAILRLFSAASSYTNNRRVLIEESGLRGTTAGLDEHGFLMVCLDSGRLERIAAGGIRPEYSAV